MAKNSVPEWDEVANNNQDIASISIAENATPPQNVNNAMRTMMAQLWSFFKSSLFVIRDATDQTKRLMFDVSAIPTITTRVVIFGSNGALDVASGGTNGTSAASARANLGTNDASNLTTGTIPDARISQTLGSGTAYRNGNFLGTVSQSGGTPTGAAIERGSNGNGEYVKFADGTMICTKTVAIGSVGFSAAGSVFISSIQAGGSFAATFIAAPVVPSPTILSTVGTVWATLGVAATTTAFPQFFLLSSNSTTSTTTTLYLAAFGRWF